MKDFIFSVLRNETIMWIIMSVLILGCTQFLKLPIKIFTKKLPEKPRKKINTIILLIPFGLGMLLSWIYFNVLPTIPELAMLFNPEFIIKGLYLGITATSMYGGICGIFKRFLGIEIKNPYESADGKKVIDAVNNIVEDGKAYKEEIIVEVKNLTKEEQELIDNILKND